MSWTLVRKELREHGLLIALAAVFSALGLAALLVQSARLGGRFVGFTLHSLYFGLLLAVVISNRLLTREYGSRTQLFLETLPIGRARVFATKWLLGAALMLLATATAWAGTLWWLRRHEVITLNAALIPLAAATVLALALWSFAAMSALLGRYRYLAWAVVVLLFEMATTYGGVARGDLPLLRLVGQGVQMAILSPPPGAFIEAAVIVAVCAIAATALALFGSGAIAMTLAQRMTARERAFIIVALLVYVGISTWLQPKKQPPPFELQDVEPIVGEHTRASVLTTPDLDEEEAQALAHTIIRDVDELIDTLRLRIRPAVFIQPQQGLDPMVMRLAQLANAEGIVLKIAPDAPRDLLRELVLHAVLSDASFDRMEREDRHIFLDGTAAYWTLRDDPQMQAVWWLRAASIPFPITRERLQAWSSTSEKLGECVSQALAFAAMDTLMQSLGRQRVLSMLRPMFTENHDDVRVLFETSPSTRLQRSGMDWAEWAARTEQAIERARQRFATELAARPRVEARVVQRRSEAGGTTLEAHVSGASAYWVLHKKLRPWTAEVINPSRFDARTSPAVLPMTPVSGTRLFTAIEMDDAVLGCPIRLFADRMDIR
jgi:hypothetical protein